jgi:hypothetical protein
VRQANGGPPLSPLFANTPGLKPGLFSVHFSQETCLQRRNSPVSEPLQGLCVQPQHQPISAMCEHVEGCGVNGEPYPTPSSAVSRQARRQHEVDSVSCCCVDLLVLVVHPTLCVHETQHNGRTRVIIISAPSTTFTNQDRPLPLSTSAARLSLAVPRWGRNRKACHRERRLWHAPGSTFWQRVCRHTRILKKLRSRICMRAE